MVNGTIVIFIKAPAPGLVKTRLIPALGAKGASELYRAMATDTLQVARQVPGTCVKVSYQVHADFKDLSWLSNKVEWFTQEGRDLGERLIHATHRVYSDSSGPLIVIGSDLPALSPALLQKAFEHLKDKSVVLGPSVDGGYYLIGLTRPIPPLFKAIPWSSSKVFKQTREILSREGITAATLSTERDIDTPEDLEYVETLGNLSPHFLRTRRFLKKQQVRVGTNPA